MSSVPVINLLILYSFSVVPHSPCLYLIYNYTIKEYIFYHPEWNFFDFDFDALGERLFFRLSSSSSSDELSSSSLSLVGAGVVVV